MTLSCNYSNELDEIFHESGGILKSLAKLGYNQNSFEHLIKCISNNDNSHYDDKCREILCHLFIAFPPSKGGRYLDVIGIKENTFSNWLFHFMKRVNERRKERHASILEAYGFL